MPPLKITEVFPSVTMEDTGLSYVFDFGQNFAGWYRFQFRGQTGQRITLRPGEVLRSNGSVDQSTTGSPIFDGYTFSGGEPETFSPKFRYHGMRYLEVFGLEEQPSKEDMTGHRIRIDVALTGQFDSSISLFNDIHKIVDQANQNQMYSVFTDCPHREKLGWLDQANLAIDPALFAYDFRTYGRHMMKQMRDSQNSIGEVPTTAPQLTEYGSWPPFGDGFDRAPNWGASIVLLAWEHYLMYGDVAILEESYDGMVAYVDYLSGLNQTSHILWSGLGDWESIDTTTPFGVTGTSAFARCAKAMTDISRVLGQHSDSRNYAKLHKEILSDFHATFLNKTGDSVTYGSGSQACDAIALNIGAVPPEYREAVYTHLENSIRDNGTHVTVGEVALPALIDTLMAQSHHDLLYDLMSSRTYPSYGFLVDQGITSMAEYWNGPLGSGSQDHVILNAGDVWLYSLAGAGQAEGSVAWRSIDFEPIIVGNLTSATMKFQSVNGPVAASWKLDGHVLTYKVTVPIGSKGNVYLPGSVGSVRLDGKRVRRGQAGVQSVSEADKKIKIKIGSGSYVFTSKR